MSMFRRRQDRPKGRLQLAEVLAAQEAARLAGPPPNHLPPLPLEPPAPLQWGDPGDVG